MSQILISSDGDFEAGFAALIDRQHALDVSIGTVVTDIIGNVRKDGFSAVAALTKKFDALDISETSVRVSVSETEQAMSDCDPDDLKALRFAAARIKSFHEKQLPSDMRYKDEQDVILGWKWTSVARAGLYAPGGKASYPSSVLMNAIPGKIAGVDTLTLCVPMPKGDVNPLVLAAAKIAGVDEVFKVGGAQAIAAMAYGAGPIDPVDVIVGPGNAYVAEAKRQVFGKVGIDAVAGPSEILVVADKNNNPAWMAADLLSQAEHDPSSQSILMTDDKGFAESVLKEVSKQLEASPRKEIAMEAWQSNSAIIVVDHIEDAVVLIDRIAPEHLELAVSDPEALMGKVRNAGAIFLGRYTPEAVGDYVAGPDHVLPTAGCARYASGLSVLNFMKRTTIIGCDEAALNKIGPAAARLADAEGLPAHAHSIRVRLED